MVILLVVALSAIAATAGSTAAVFDARRQTWRMVLYGTVVIFIVTIVFIGIAMNTIGGSLWHVVLLLPLAASFVILYLITRLIVAARRR